MAAVGDEMIKLNAAPVFLIYKLHTTKDGLMQAGVPMPIYLDEELTGLGVANESDSLSISSDYVPVLNGNPGKDGKSIKVLQRGENQQTSITLVGEKNSIGLNILLPLMKSILSQVFAQREYRIAYFNKNVLIFNARLTGYQMTPGENDTRITISITLEVLPDKEDSASKLSVKGGALEEIPTKAV